MKHRKQSYILSYPHSLGERIYSLVLGPLLIVTVLFFVLRYFNLTSGTFSGISYSDLGTATALTLYRLVVAYVVALIVAVPLALFVTNSSFTERIFLPMFDILESIPILAFFPIIIIFFIKLNMLNGAAIFILFLSMLWNIVFTLIGGLKIIPKDITYAAYVFKIRGIKYIRQVVLPAIFPEIVTGSILAVAQGWNLIIVAEVMHVYIPNGTAQDDLFGLGSILVKSASSGQTDLFIASLAIMILIIAITNFLVWQKLLHYAQRFKFE
jgi:NitT/TauT family transport system permease protein